MSVFDIPPDDAVGVAVGLAALAVAVIAQILLEIWHADERARQAAREHRRAEGWRRLAEAVARVTDPDRRTSDPDLPDLPGRH